MDLLNLITEINREDVRARYVDKLQIVSNSEFSDVEKYTKNKLAYTQWLLKLVATKAIKKEDLYKYEEYLDTFNRNKKDYQVKDINQIKDKQGLDSFLKTTFELLDKEKQDPSQQKGISKQDKYAHLQIGSVDGFDVYKIPKGSTDKSWYNISCDLGSGTDWCTATGKTNQYYSSYISQGPLYIFIKPGSDEKYQFHFESRQFMDKNDYQADQDAIQNLINFLHHKEKTPKLPSPKELIQILDQVEFTKKYLPEIAIEAITYTWDTDFESEQAFYNEQQNSLLYRDLFSIGKAVAKTLNTTYQSSDHSKMIDRLSQKTLGAFDALEPRVNITNYSELLSTQGAVAVYNKYVKGKYTSIQQALASTLELVLQQKVLQAIERTLRADYFDIANPFLEAEDGVLGNQIQRILPKDVSLVIPDTLAEEALILLLAQTQVLSWRRDHIYLGAESILIDEVDPRPFELLEEVSSNN